jgi:hypothetical protein
MAYAVVMESMKKTQLQAWIMIWILAVFWEEVYDNSS